MSSLRIVGPQDVAAVVAIFLECWQVSYREVMPAALVERMTPDYAESLWSRSLSAAAASYVGAEDADGRLVGFVGFQLTDGGSGYISSLYVSPGAQGGGYGRRLLARAEEELKALGATAARLWVFEQNAPSRRFYERSGWTLDGRREILPEWGEPQLGMRKAL